MNQLAANLFKDIGSYRVRVDEVSICTSYDADEGRAEFQTVPMDAGYLERLENQARPDVQCMLTLIQMYVALFQGYMRLAYEKAAEHSLTYTSKDVLQCSIIWWSTKANIDDLLAMDKEYYASALENLDSKMIKAFIRTFNELNHFNSLSNPMGLCINDGVPRIPFDDVVLGQTLFAVRDKQRVT